VNNPANLLLVDDHAIFRSGLNKLLADTGRFSVSGEASNIDEARNYLSRLPELNMIILDINLEGKNALDLIPTLRDIRPDIPILIMSMYPADQFASAAYRAGANGYLAKDTSQKQLYLALNTLLQGKNYQPAEIKTKDGSLKYTGYPHEQLSKRELEVFKLISNGETLTDIGTQMFISVKTVSTHRSRILEKLGLNNNADIVKYAMRHGFSV